jgi:hypothetical protein
MVKTNAMQLKSHTVNVNVVMDVMSILFNNDIPFQVEGINEHENTMLLRTTTNPKLTRHKKALDNLKTLMSDYIYYRHESESGNTHNSDAGNNDYEDEDEY